MFYILLLTGLYTTIKLALTAGVISLTIGTFMGLISSERLRYARAQKLIGTYVFLFRSIPLYVQALIMYFVIPDIVTLSFSPFIAGALALGLCSAAYVTEIVCTTINALPVDMWESGYLVGFTCAQTIRYIIFPQAGIIALPLLINEWESLLKSTSVLSAIGVLELTKAGMNIVAHTMQPIPVYLSIACIYLILSACTAGIKYLTLRYAP